MKISSAKLTAIIILTIVGTIFTYTIYAGFELLRILGDFGSSSTSSIVIGAFQTGMPIILSLAIARVAAFLLGRESRVLLWTAFSLPVTLFTLRAVAGEAPTVEVTALLVILGMVCLVPLGYRLGCRDHQQRMHQGAIEPLNSDHQRMR